MMIVGIYYVPYIMETGQKHSYSGVNPGQYPESVFSCEINALCLLLYLLIDKWNMLQISVSSLQTEKHGMFPAKREKIL